MTALSQRAAAELLGVSARTLRAWTKADPARWAWFRTDTGRWVYSDIQLEAMQRRAGELAAERETS